VQRTSVSGVAVASILHYEFNSRRPIDAQPTPTFSRIAPAALGDIKQALIDAGCQTRMPRTQVAR